VATRSVIEVAATGSALSVALEQSVAYAKEHDQLALWDRSSRSCAVAVYDDATKQLRALSDEESAMLLNRDPTIRRDWRRWNAMTGNQGTLIVIDAEHVRAVLEPGSEEQDGDDQVSGLA
jgi:hypothetical protein